MNKYNKDYNILYVNYQLDPMESVYAKTLIECIVELWVLETMIKLKTMVFFIVYYFKWF